MASAVQRTRRLVRRIVGPPIGSGTAPGRVTLLFERHQVLFESIAMPPLPTPLLLVHTGGKPLAYQAAGRARLRQSLPGLVTFMPASVRADVTLRGVGEGTVVHFEHPVALPAWLHGPARREPVTFTNDVIVATTRRLMAEFEQPVQPAAYVRALARALLAELQRELEASQALALASATRGELRIAHAAVRYVREHLGEPLAVPALAAACGVGVTTLNAAVRQATGLTPHRYLRRARIERAAELLRTTALGIGEIAAMVGFRGQAHFCSAFGRERGLTPGSYRRQCREGIGG